ncbi:DMT family transporter, partial [Rhizobiaceae sp. 2RAB30]
MTALVLIALLNGWLIAASRSINGRLGMSIGALRSSFWNHLGGLILLTALL